MNVIKKPNLFYYISLLLMANTFLPVVFYNLPPILSSFNLLLIIWGLLLIYFYFEILISKVMLILISSWFLFVFAINSIWINFDDWNHALIADDYKNIIIGVSVITYFIHSKDYINLAKLTKWSIVFIIITAIMTIFSSAIDPMYARNIIGVGSLTIESEKESVMSFKRLGGADYSMAIVFMCILPIIIYYLKNNRESIVSKRWIFIFVAILLLALIGLQIFTNILIAVLFIIFALLGMKKIRESMLILFFFITVFFIIPKNIYVDSLISVSDYFTKDSELNTKFKDFAIFIETGADIENSGNAASQRAERYPMLWETFQKSPVMGCYFDSDKNGNGYQELGGHLYWMNKLTTTGIVGLVFFVLIFYFHIKMNLRYFNSNFKFFYLLSVVSFLSYGLFKNMGGRESWFTFFIILPGMYYLPLLKKVNKEEVQPFLN